MSLATGQKAPEFTLQDTEGNPVSLSIFQDKHNVVLLFFPLAFSDVCTNELCKTRDNMKIYDSLDAKILGISVDSFFTLHEFKKSQNLNFPLLSDFNKKVSQNYDALYDDYFGMKGVAKRSAYVVSKEGIIEYAEVLENSDNLPDFDAVQNTLQRLTD